MPGPHKFAHPIAALLGAYLSSPNDSFYFFGINKAFAKAGAFVLSQTLFKQQKGPADGRSFFSYRNN